MGSTVHVTHNCKRLLCYRDYSDESLVRVLEGGRGWDNEQVCRNEELESL